MMGRKGFWTFVLVNLAIIIFLIHNVWTLLTLLVVDGSSDAISRAELPGPNSEVPKGKQMLIPKIIHQTYINDTIPPHWKPAQKSCQDLHEDYEYKVRCAHARYGMDTFANHCI
jgi:mannosyltransferase OCH1-like enzyme